jgi:hypothetical protein
MVSSSNIWLCYALRDTLAVSVAFDIAFGALAFQA